MIVTSLLVNSSLSSVHQDVHLEKDEYVVEKSCLFLWNFGFAGINVVDDIMWCLSVDKTAN